MLTKPEVQHLLKTIVCALLLAFPVNAQQVIIAADDRNEHHVELLVHVLSYADTQYDIDISGHWLPKKRALQQLADGTKLQVVAGSLSGERAKNFYPIPIPLVKGLLGWRISLVNKNNQNILKDVKSLAQLSTLTGGGHHSWSDTKVLESNNLKVLKSDSVRGLFRMLDKSRFDYFPRSAIKINKDLKSNDNYDIAIDPYVLIKYPHAYVYFVNTEQAKLAKDIESGLLKAKADGSFDQIFDKHYGTQVTELLSQSRTVIELDNPSFPLPKILDNNDFWLLPTPLSDNANSATIPKTK